MIFVNKSIYPISPYDYKLSEHNPVKSIIIIAIGKSASI